MFRLIGLKKTIMNTNLTVEIVKITPEIAINYLRFNNVNRKKSVNNLQFLIKEMQSGRFLENGEAIIFDKHGELKDGQHRLTAILKTGNCYNIPVVRGVEPIAMSTLDTGKNRSAGDVLSLNGFQSANNIASLILGIDKFGNTKSKGQNVSGGNRRDKLTNQQVLEYCQLNYHWLIEVYRNCESIYRAQTNPKVLTNTQIGIFAYLLGGENPKKEVYDFLKNITGLSRTMDTATSYLFTKLFNSKINKEPLNFYWTIGMIIKAFNYFIEGNPAIKYFKFSIDQELPKVNTIK